MSYASDGIGDNKELALSVAGNDYTLHFTNSDSLTSADDTASDFYFDNLTLTKKFNLRTDQALRIVSFNGRTLTDPILVAANAQLTRDFEVPLLRTMVLRTTAADTNVQVLCGGNDYNG